MRTAQGEVYEQEQSNQAYLQKGGLKMSYYCQISFKTIEANEVYSFFQELKKATISHLKEIAKENAFYCPAERLSDYANLPKSVAWGLDRSWAYRCFTYRYFYLPQHKLLGVFGLPTQITGLFDCTVEFQNSCDQNYEYEEWNGVPLFEGIVSDWKATTAEALKQKFKENCGCDFDEEYKKCSEEELEEKYDYWRKSFVYGVIWSMFEEYLENDSEALSLSLFNPHETATMGTYTRLCMKNAEAKKQDIFNQKG